jgi:hypothetical protein
MKSLWLAAVVATLLNAASACAQSAASKPSSDNSPAQSMAADLLGTDMVAELSHSVSAKKAKPGDLVKAALTQDVLAHGRIIIRRGSKLMGHITETKVRTKDDQESRLGMVFDKALLKGGQEIDFTAAIQALAPAVQVSSVDQPDQMPPPLTGNTINQPGNLQPVGGTASRGTMSGSNTSTKPTNTASAATQSAQIDQAASSTASSGSGSTHGLMGGGARGVFGLPGLQLTAAGPEHATIITSSRQNVKLESGTQLVIQVNNLAR